MRSHDFDRLQPEIGLMPFSISKLLVCLSMPFFLANCAFSVSHIPADITLVAAAEQRDIVTLDKQIDILLDTGYKRTLKAGSQWARVGKVAQGDVYKSHNAIFTLEGAHVHEAWLVVADGRLTGFYLPVEHGFSPIAEKIDLSFFSTRYKREQ